MLCATRVAVLTVLLLLLGGTAPLSAQRTIHVPQDQPTIQAGIVAAKNGDTVLVAPGHYNEAIDFKGKAITVESSAGPASTTIDATWVGGYFTVTFQSKEGRTSVLKGFTIMGGGMLPPPQARPIIEGLEGGIQVVGSAAPTIIGNIISGNACNGIFFTGAPLVENNQISGNVNPGYASKTMGADFSQPGCVQPFDSAGPGGFFLKTPAEGSVWFASSGIFQAYDPDQVPPSLPAVIVGNTIEKNTNDVQTTVFVDKSNPDCAQNFVAPPNQEYPVATVIENNIIRNNSSKYLSGGGLCIGRQMAPLIVAQNLIYGNSAGSSGGGVAFDLIYPSGYGPPPLLFVNNLVANNIATTGEGSQIGFLYSYNLPNEPAGDYPPEFANNILLGSNHSVAANANAAAVAVFQSGLPNAVQPTIYDHNDIFNPTGPPFYSQRGEQSPVGAYGNISADPLFADAANGDYHLQAGSPAIDAGNNSALQQLANASFPLTRDLDGHSRAQDGSGVGYPVVDMGPYEYAGAQQTGSTTLLLTPATFSPTAGTQLPLTAQLISPLGVPTGNVTFYLNGASIGTEVIDATGAAKLDTPALTEGIDALLATYPGQGAFTPAVAVEVLIFVQPSGSTPPPTYPTATTLTSDINPQQIGLPVTFTATVAVSPLPTGPPPLPPVGHVAFFDNGSPLGMAEDSGGTATLTTSALTVGLHQITASYTPSSTEYLPSTSAAYAERIVPPQGSFDVTVSPGAQTLYTGEATRAITVTVTPIGDWVRDVTLSCSNVPAETTCTFTKPTIAGGNGSSQLVIQTAAPHHVASAADRPRDAPFRPLQTGFVLAALGLFVAPFGRRSSRLRRILGAFLLVALAITIAPINGCGAPKDTGGTPPAMYNISIDGTFSMSGYTQTHSSTVTLTVKSLF